MCKRFYKFIRDNNELWFHIYNATEIRFESGTFELEDHEETSNKSSEQQGKIIIQGMLIYQYWDHIFRTMTKKKMKFLFKNPTLAETN